MCPVIRVPDDLYKRLEQLAKGFDTPTKVIERLAIEHEELHGIRKRPKASAASTSHDRPTLIFYPRDAEEFKSQLLAQRRAFVLVHKLDGSTERSVWRAGRFRTTSNLRGNLWSGYLRGWKQKGITKAEFAINEKDLSRAG